MTNAFSLRTATTFAVALMVSALTLCQSATAAERSGYFETYFPAHDASEPLLFQMAVEWRIWIPEDVPVLRGIVLHQHGCGEGSGNGARTAVYDLHWQELARRHECALMAPSFRQDDADCELWCDPRNGSAQSLLDALEYFAVHTEHPELTSVPWTLWGHSGGGRWVGSMVHLYPKRIAAAWLRSGCPLILTQTFEDLPVNQDVLDVPMMLNIGAREYDFGLVWEPCWNYFSKMREQGAKIGFLIDPTTHHETGNSRYPAIRFLDECMTARLSEKVGSSELRPTSDGFILPIEEISDAELSAENPPDEKTRHEDCFDAPQRRKYLKKGIWLPSKDYLAVWRLYSRNADFVDTTPPPAPTDVKLDANGRLTWKCRADLESGLAAFVISKNGRELKRMPTAPCVNSRPVFQGVMYSDTPDYSLPKMEWSIPDEEADENCQWTVTAANTAGLVSKPAEAVRTPKSEKH